MCVLLLPYFVSYNSTLISLFCELPIFGFPWNKNVFLPRYRASFQVISILHPPQVSFYKYKLDNYNSPDILSFIFIDQCQECEIILTFGIIHVSPPQVVSLWMLFFPSPFPPDLMPSYDEKSDPFLFQSLFSLLISVFVVLTDSVSLYGFWCIPHALHGKWYKFNPCCFWII